MGLVLWCTCAPEATDGSNVPDLSNVIGSKEPAISLQPFPGLPLQTIVLYIRDLEGHKIRVSLRSKEGKGGLQSRITLLLYLK